MVGPPPVMAGKVGVLLNRRSGDWGFARPSAANNDRHATEIDEDLRGTTRYRVGGDRGTEHLHVPIGRRFWVLADDVDVIEFERWIAHRLHLIFIGTERSAIPICAGDARSNSLNLAFVCRGARTGIGAAKIDSVGLNPEFLE